MSRWRVMPTASDFTGTLLGPADVSPVIRFDGSPESPLLFCCDHAGARIPSVLGSLGVNARDLQDHIAIDIGIFATTSWLAGMLRAPLIAQIYSRLVIDSNRKIGTAGSIPVVSDGRHVPANRHLDDADKECRAGEILLPYQTALGMLLRERTASLGYPPVLVAMHSFTRRLSGASDRQCDIGVIYDGENEFGSRLHSALSAIAPDLRVQDNEPYRINATEDYTLPVHAIGKQQPYVEIEICQDLISTCEGQRALAEIMRLGLIEALATGTKLNDR